MSQVNKVNLQAADVSAMSNHAKAVSSSKQFSDVLKANAGENNHNEKASVAEKKCPHKKPVETSNNQKVPDGKQEVESKADQLDSGTKASKIEELSSEVEQFVEDLKQKISEILDVSVEELNKMMADSGLVPMDLLSPNVLQQLVLSANQSFDPSALLTNEAMGNQMKELLSAVESMTKDVDLGNIQAVLEQWKQAEADTKEKTNQNIENVKQPEVSTDEEDSSIKKQDEPVITVQREGVSEEKDSTSKNNHQESQTEQQNSPFHQFIEKLEQSVDNSQSLKLEPQVRQQQMADIVNQVVERLKVFIRPDSTSMDIQLNPEHLGKVNVSIVAKNGEMTAAFTVENHLAKEALESQMTSLRDNLEKQGVKVDAVEVTVAQQGFDQRNFAGQNQGQFQNKQQKSHISAKSFLENEKNEAEENQDSKPVLSTGTVDYSA